MWCGEDEMVVVVGVIRYGCTRDEVALILGSWGVASAKNDAVVFARDLRTSVGGG